jgi:hypothetical protein
VQLRVRVQRPTDLQVQWCERHLLYDGHCQTVQWRAEPRGGEWQTQTLWLRDDGPATRSSHAPRLALFTLSVLQAGGMVDISRVRLRSAQGANLLVNANFTQGLAHWQGTAQSYFLPWHIDNLFLELLIERGLIGLLVFGALLGAALWYLTLGAARHLPLAPYQAAALTAALCVGLSGSLLDVPRVAFLLYLLTLDAVLQGQWAGAGKWLVRAKNQRPKMPSAQTAASTQQGGRPA